MVAAGLGLGLAAAAVAVVVVAVVEEEEEEEGTPGCSQEEEEGNLEKGQGLNWAATWVLLSQQEGTVGLHWLRLALRAATPWGEGWEAGGTGWLSASLWRALGTAEREAVLHRSSDVWGRWVGALDPQEQQERVEREKREKLAAFLLGELEEWV